MIDIITFEGLYQKQINFQKKVLKKGLYNFENIKDLPYDEPKIFSQHIQHMISELGEVLSADKRWKSFRNGHYDEDNKKEELADCFIVLMNMCIFSGFTAEDMEKAILDKMIENMKRVDEI